MASTTQFSMSREIDIYGSNHRIGVWGESSNANVTHNANTAATGHMEIKTDANVEDISSDVSFTSTINGRASNRPAEKSLRRLAQNREAARKSRLKKKAYVQQLESSQEKLTELQRALEGGRQQGMFGCAKSSSILHSYRGVNPGVATFEMEYGHWIEEQNKQVSEIRVALQQDVSDIELRMLVKNGLCHYGNLFKMKATAAKFDVFYILFGMWKTGAERCFLWLGGSRPSELLKVLTPHLDLLTEQQLDSICRLQKSCQQAEDALLQGMDRLQYTLFRTLSDSSSSSDVVNYVGQMEMAIGKLEALVGFVNQADHLRLRALHEMHKILTIRQAAKGLLALGDYFQRLRALDSLWATRHHGNT